FPLSVKPMKTCGAPRNPNSRNAAMKKAARERAGGVQPRRCAMPLISVVIPTYNRPEMLAEALASVRAQTLSDYEIIVLSNGESFTTQRQSHRVAIEAGARWSALDEGNLPAARNFGIEQANGEWIAFLDDDDLWLTEQARTAND